VIASNAKTNIYRNIDIIGKNIYTDNILLLSSIYPNSFISPISLNKKEGFILKINIIITTFNNIAY